MRRIFLLLGAAGATGNFALIVWEAVTFASTPTAAVVAAFQKGFLTACALLGPMLGAHLIRELPTPRWARIASGILCAAVVLCFMGFNGKQSLDAYLKTTDATIAERSKVKDAADMARAELKRLQALPPLSVPSTTAETVKAADEALKAAVRVRVAACGDDNERLNRSKCKDAQKDEHTARAALATAQGNKDATDAAAKATARKEVLEAQLRGSPAIADADPGGAVFERLFGVDPALGRTWQGIVGVLLIELGIAALLFGFEMLRQKAAPMVETPIAAPTVVELRPVEPDQSRPGRSETPTNVVPFPSVQPEHIELVERFLLANIEHAKGSELSWVTLCRRHQRWCAEQNVTALPVDIFGKVLDGMRKNGDLDVRISGDDVYCLNVRFIGRKRLGSSGRMGKAKP